MILKVPIYVDIEKMHPDDIPKFVESLSDMFQKILRKENFRNMKLLMTDVPKERSLVAPFSVITKKKALDFLRTGK